MTFSLRSSTGGTIPQFAGYLLRTEYSSKTDYIEFTKENELRCGDTCPQAEVSQIHRT
ncbi:hypothetical protein OAF74_01240 [bacterium]|nr:hypothetical protein [bacterium]